MSEKYSFSLTTFSPSGKLVQIEYAIKTVSEGSACLGIKVSAGVVLVAEKHLPALADASSIEKVCTVSPVCGVTFSGLAPDFATLCRKARKQCQVYNALYGHYPACPAVVRQVSDTMQEYTQSGGVRPFGISCLFAGTGSPGGTGALFQLDPAGSAFEWKATAIGKHSVARQAFLEKRYAQAMSIDDTVSTALLVLKDGFEGQMSARNVEIGIYTTRDNAFRTLTDSETREYIAAI